jgi:hypothetical protein
MDHASPIGVMASAREVKQMIQLKIRILLARTLHLVEHALAVTIGLALVVVGLALTFSVVFVVPGIIVLSLGVATVAAGVFAHAFTRQRGA